MGIALALVGAAVLAGPHGPVRAQTFDADRFGNLEWRSIGPARGGRSLACSGSPGRRHEYYFGATGGGLWKTTDGGTTWRPVTDGQVTSSSVGAIGVSETNPDIVYIGMGETQLRGSITQGDGVYKTADGGKTWRHLGLADTQAIARIRVHPTNPDVVYVAALGHPYGDHEERGVFRSTDGGNTWEKVLYVSPRAGAADLIIDRRNPDVVYASLWQVYRKAWKMWGGGPDSGLYKSTDGGETWTALTSNPGMPESPIGKIGITVSPADSDRLWAVVEANEGGVFRSDDGGATWERTNAERKIRQRHFYYSRIYADPLDRDTVYALNVDFWKSTDGGTTFDIEIEVPHGDNHDLWLDPNDPRRMCNSNDGGGNVSINGGETWTEQDFVTTQLYHVTTTNDFPYHVCGAQQDNSTVCVPSGGWDFMQARGPNHGWYYAAGGGESGYVAPHPSLPGVFYAGSQGALLTRYDRSNGQTRDIQVYPRFFSGEPASALPERWQWTFPIVFSPLDDRVLYTSSQHLWRTTTDGQRWERISPDLTRADPETLGESGGLITGDMNGPEIYATIFAVAPSHHDLDTIWVGSDDGLVHVTRDGGEAWAIITPPDMPDYSRVSVVDESPHAPGTAYVAANRYQVDDREPYVWRTRDYGESWTKIVSGIPAGHFARAVREDPVREGLLFLGTEHGVYISFDAGDAWQSLQLNLPDTPIRDLVVTDSDVVLGTHGRGFWILDDIEPFRQMQPGVYDRSLTLFEPGRAVRGVERAAIQFVLREQVDRVSVEILAPGGETVATFEGTEPTWEPDPNLPRRLANRSTAPTTAAGLNRFEWDLRYPGPAEFEQAIMWGATYQLGPKAVPGRYQARVTAGDQTATTSFDVVLDPRLKGVTQADVEEQFALARKIRDDTNAAHEAVLQIRRIREALVDRLEASTDAEFQREGQDLLTRIQAVEEELIQVRNRSTQDTLNFPIKLNNRLAALRRSVETGDAKPTDAASTVQAELRAELQRHLDTLSETLGAPFEAVNERLRRQNLDPLEK